MMRVRVMNKRQFKLAILAAGATIFAVQSSSATDFTLDASLSAPSLSANDTVTIDSFYGADNNTDSNLIDVDVDDISITINGTLQGGNDLIIGSDYMDNLAISIAEGGEVVVSGCYGKRGDVVDKLEDYINQLYDENPSADLNTVLTALEDLSGTAYEEALGLISANAPSAIAQATSQNMRTVNGFIAQRAAIQAGGNAARQTLRMMTSADPLIINYLSKNASPPIAKKACGSKAMAVLVTKRR